jgi:cyclopropane fatty-acyl-phospholipid synthase-like methyltransferase
MTDAGRVYVGSELELFAAATRWKRYLAAHIHPYLGRRVLEVGAGVGGTTRVLCDGGQARWLCLEPDRRLARTIEERRSRGDLPLCCEARVGTLQDLGQEERFDSVLYVDVLEHIADDAAELRLAASRLERGGHLVVVAPAHEWLYSEFDAAIGHHRRYTRRMLAALTPEGLEVQTCAYLDSVGLLASAGNRLLLRRGHPSATQIWVWDTFMVRLSRVVDVALRYRVGKSVLAVWRRCS